MAAERQGRLARVVEHAPDVRSLFLRLEEPLPFTPGQFISCLLPTDAGILTRPYSIASSPEQPEELELLLNRVPGGPGSTHLCALDTGAPVRFTGPWGLFVLEAQPAAPTVFIADGTGIAPIRPMLRRALATGGAPIDVLYARAPGAPAVYGAELRALAAEHPRLGLEEPVSDALVATVRRRYVEADDDRDRHFFICGVGEPVVAMRRMLRAAGYERHAVLYERW